MAFLAAIPTVTVSLGGKGGKDEGGKARETDGGEKEGTEKGKKGKGKDGAIRQHPLLEFIGKSTSNINGSTTSSSAVSTAEGSGGGGGGEAVETEEYFSIKKAFRVFLTVAKVNPLVNPLTSIAQQTEAEQQPSTTTSSSPTKEPITMNREASSRRLTSSSSSSSSSPVGKGGTGGGGNNLITKAMFLARLEEDKVVLGLGETHLTELFSRFDSNKVCISVWVCVCMSVCDTCVYYRMKYALFSVLH